MDNALQAIKDNLVKNTNIGIAVGKNPNLDAMGAALALYLALKDEGKNVTVACPTEPLVEISSLVGINKVKQNFSGEGGDLVVSFPYQEGEIEKVSYTLEEGYLNIVVKAGEKGLTFDKNDIKYRREGSAPSLLFVVGTPRISDLGRLFDPEALKNTTVINIDNKSENQGFGEIVFVSSSFSSVSEQVVNLLTFLGMEINTDIAQNLLSGISFSTDNFQDPKTTPLAFELASLLMKKGAIRTRIVKQKGYSEDTSFLNALSSATVDDFRSKDQSFKDQPFRPQQQKQPQFRNNPSPFQKQSNQGGFNQSAQNPFQQTQRNVNPSSSGGQNQKLAPKAFQDVNSDDDQETPSDWLTPKIYKGSTSVE